MFRWLVYIVLVFEIILHLPVHVSDSGTLYAVDIIRNIGFFNSLVQCKVIEVMWVIIVAIGTKAQKDIKFNMMRMVVIPACVGMFLIIMSVYLNKGHWGMDIFGYSLNRILYLITSIVGLMLLQKGLDGLAKYFNQKIGEDRFNFENESFEQSDKINKNEYSVNIPMIYYWQKKMHHGWINIINPFRGTLRAEKG